MDSCEVSWRVCMVDRVLPMPLHAVVFRTCHWPLSNIWGFAGRPLIMYRKLETDLNVLDSFWFHNSKKILRGNISISKPMQCLRSCCSRCCSPGRFRDRGLVVAAAAKGKTCKNPQEMLRDLGLERGERKLGKRQGESRDRNRWVIMTKLIAYPIFYKVLYIPGGAGFPPSTVSQV